MARRRTNFTVQDEIRRDRRMRQTKNLRRARTRLQRFFTGTLCIGVFLLLAFTVTVIVTRVQTVSVSGNLRYSDTELLEAAAIDGEILPFLREENVYSRIVAVCPYVETVELVKTYPSAVEIRVRETESVYAAQVHGKWLSLDADLRVMDYMQTPAGLIVLQLPAVQSALEGSRLQFADTESDAFVTEMLDLFFPKGGEHMLTALDLTDRYSVVGMVGETAKILFGDYRNMDIKFTMAQKVLADAEAEASMRTLVDVSEPSRASAQYDYKGEF